MAGQGSALLLSKELARAYEGQAKKFHFLYAINRVFTSSSDTGYLYKSRYYLDMPTVSGLFGQAAKLPEYQRNLALPAIGNTLYSNYKEDQETTRSDALRTVQEGLALLKKSGGTVALEAPSAFALEWADALYNVDMTHSRYIFETDAVPFLQIVISGRAPLFSPYLNLNAGGKTTVLQMIDYNVYPAYMLTESASDKMTQCNINYVYSSRFEDYLPDLIQVYDQINPILRQVAGAGISSRTCPQDGVSVVRYDNGRTIIVNYTSGEVTVEGTAVPAQQAVCI